jgi:outer membrane protein assembly factor BamB
MAYNDRIILVNAANGLQIEMKDEDGSVVVDNEGKTVKWQLTGEQNAPANFFATPVLLDENTLIAATYEGKLLRVDVQDASVKSSSTLMTGQLIAGGGCTGNCILTDLLLQDDTLYVAGLNHDVFAVEPSDLTVRWTFPTEHGVWSKPVAGDGVVYFTSMDHFLYGVDIDTGEELWKLDLGGAIAGSPVLSDDTLYVGNLARKVFAVSTDGEIIAEYTTEDWVWGTVNVVDSVVYTADLSGNVYALDAENNLQLLWKQKAAPMGIRPTPLLVGNDVIVASRNGSVYWLDKNTGAVRFPKEIGAEILSDLLYIELNRPIVVVSTVANDRLLVGLYADGSGEAFRYGQ